MQSDGFRSTPLAARIPNPEPTNLRNLLQLLPARKFGKSIHKYPSKYKRKFIYSLDILPISRLCFWKCKLSYLYDPRDRPPRRLVCPLVRLSVIISQQGGKLHFHEELSWLSFISYNLLLTINLKRRQTWGFKFVRTGLRRRNFVDVIERSSLAFKSCPSCSKKTPSFKLRTQKNLPG